MDLGLGQNPSFLCSKHLQCSCPAGISHCHPASISCHCEAPAFHSLRSSKKHENCFSTLILINTIIANLWVSILLFSLDKCKDLWRTIQSLGIIYQCSNCCKEISQKDAWTRNQSRFEFHVGHSNLTATLTKKMAFIYFFISLIKIIRRADKN